MSLRTSKNRSASRKKADRYFSKYIRISNAHHNGRCQCVTCGNWHNWKHIQCGHWRRRGLEPTRYDERNVAPQCVRCNKHRSGEPERFEEHIRATYGAEVVEDLKVKSLMRSKRSQSDYEWIAKKYYEKLKKLETSIN